MGIDSRSDNNLWSKFSEAAMWQSFGVFYCNLIDCPTKPLMIATISLNVNWTSLDFFTIFEYGRWLTNLNACELAHVNVESTLGTWRFGGKAPKANWTNLVLLEDWDCLLRFSRNEFYFWRIIFCVACQKWFRTGGGQLSNLNQQEIEFISKGLFAIR